MFAWRGDVHMPLSLFKAVLDCALGFELSDGYISQALSYD